MIGRLVQQEEFGRLGRGKDGGEARAQAFAAALLELTPDGDV